MIDFRCLMNALAGACLLSLGGLAAAPAVAETQPVSASGLQELIQQGVTVIDVRRVDEWRTTGIVPGSQTITAFDLEGRLNPDFFNLVAALLPPDQPVALICRSGNRSAKAAQMLSERLGYQKVYDVEGGMQRWLLEQRPTTACPSC